MVLMDKVRAFIDWIMVRQLKNQVVGLAKMQSNSNNHINGYSFRIRFNLANGCKVNLTEDKVQLPLINQKEILISSAQTGSNLQDAMRWSVTGNPL